MQQIFEVLLTIEVDVHGAEVLLDIAVLVGQVGYWSTP